MKQGKVIGFNAAKMAEQMMANAVAEQNRRLVEYAGFGLAFTKEGRCGNLQDGLFGAPRSEVAATALAGYHVPSSARQSSACVPII